ncbi:SAM-dependent methyltransferase, partial [Actinomadura adrarensis]
MPKRSPLSANRTSREIAARMIVGGWRRRLGGRDMTTDERHPAWVIDPEKPNVARIYDYVLGGKDNFTADREAAEQVMAALPHVVHSA